MGAALKFRKLRAAAVELGPGFFIGLAFAVVVLWLSRQLGPLFPGLGKDNGPSAEDVLFRLLVAVGTFWGLYNTRRIIQQVTSEIYGFSDLMRSVCDELEHVAKCTSAEAKVVPPFFYMYVKTPAFGHISAAPDLYKDFRDYLKLALVNPDVKVRIVCLERAAFEPFHKELISNEEKQGACTAEAVNLFDAIQRDHAESLTTQAAIGNCFLVVCPNRAWQFMIKPVPGNGRHEVSGRIIRKSADIRFAKESIEAHWLSVGGAPAVAVAAVPSAPATPAATATADPAPAVAVDPRDGRAPMGGTAPAAPPALTDSAVPLAGAAAPAGTPGPRPS